MAPFAGNGIRVRGPQVDVIGPRPFGLFSVAPPQTLDQPFWMAGGVNWEDDLCGDNVIAFLDNCPPATGFTKPANRVFNFCHADPFQVMESFDCSTGGRAWRSGEAFEIARRRLLVWEQYAVERTFWTGASANGAVNPSLAFGNEDCDIEVEDVTGASPVNALDSLVILETAMHDIIPNGGVIHVPTSIISYLDNFKNLIERDGGYYTRAGNRIVAGAGYTGTGPGGAAPAADTTWIYGTGPVAVYQSNMFTVPDDLSQAVNRSINDITVRAERYFSVAFSCGVFAINVELTCAC